MKTPDTAHLSSADAELVRALYLERNTVNRSELTAVRAAAAAQSDTEHRHSTERAA